MYESELEVARQAARMAGQLCLQIRKDLLGTPEAMEKAGREPVTIADFSAQAVILKHISEHFPDDAVYAEEKGADFDKLGSDEQHQRVLDYVGGALEQDVTKAQITEWLDFGRGAESNRAWAVDPIDGTKGFIRGDHFAIAIALLVDGEVVMGALGCPVFPLNKTTMHGEPGIVATAIRGQHASIYALDDDTPRGLGVSSTPDPAYAKMVESVESGHTDHDFSANVIEEVGVGGEPVRIDSQAKYAAVADGRAEIYIRNSRGDYNERIWDHAAGSIVVEAAGGTVTDLDGKPLDFSRGQYLTENRGVLATNGHLHELLLEAIGKHSS